MSGKAVRTMVSLGSLMIEGFMLPDGSYRMSQTQAAECVDKPEINARRFLSSTAIKALLGQGYTPDTLEIESTTRGQSRFNALPLEVVTAYWFHQASQGNKKALSLVWPLLTESLERRFDAAFGISRSESDRDELLTQRMQQLERDLNTLGEAFAIDDEIKRERDYYERLLRDHGIDPWGSPAIEGVE